METTGPPSTPIEVGGKTSQDGLGPVGIRDRDVVEERHDVSRASRGPMLRARAAPGSLSMA